MVTSDTVGYKVLDKLKNDYREQIEVVQKTSVSDPYSLNPDLAKNLNPDPDPDPGKFFSQTKKFA